MRLWRHFGELSSIRRHSVRRQFALIFTGLMASTILLCWFMNNMFLEQYYVSNKTDILFDAYHTISQAANRDTYSTEAFWRELNNVCGVYNITVCVMDADTDTRYVSTNGGAELRVRLIAYLFGFLKDDVKVIEEGKDYVAWKVRLGDEEYLEMCGRLNSGISFIMRTPVESIRESVNISNRFLAYVGIGATLGGSLIIWFVSGKITKPILKLSDISERMVHLDFDVKYREHARNEIDLLGENINKLSASLEQSIGELKTANNELQKDIEKKEQIDEMRKEFLANVSHELKTPIALIQGYAEGLMEGISDDPESRSFYCEVIMDEAAKMNNMVKKLLTLNQLEFGNDVVSMERFDVAALLENYLQSAGILLRQKGIQARMEGPSPMYVWADEFKVEEVFANYFTNAVNHCQASREIVISLEEREGTVRVSVFNTGEAIPREALSHLWEKFYKVDKARTREYGGSGVGLSIVKAIMESLNQKYGVENREDGVVFWFELDSAG